MKYIDIFVAGSKTVNEYRDILKIIASELNVENKLKGKKIIVRMCDYRDLGDNQKKYDNYIKRVANVFFVVVDGLFGEVTKTEMTLAADKYGEERQSKIKVFVKGNKDDENANKEIYKTINELLGDGQYGVDFPDQKDFKTKAKKYIKQYIDEANKKEKQISIMRKIFAAMVIVAVMIGGFFLHSLMPKDTTLLFAGGGSAKNLINSEYGLELSQYTKNSLYVNMPSGNSWQLVKEDLLHKDSPTSFNFKPIAVSAAEANDSVFLPSGYDYEKFCEKGRIISVKIGYDELVVYMGDSLAKKYPDSTISKQQLSQLIAEQKQTKKLGLKTVAHVYTTEIASGTYKGYRDVLGIADLDSVDKILYGSETNLKSVAEAHGGEMKVLLLASEFYKPGGMDNLSMVKKAIVDEEGKAYRKPVYLYFAAEVDASKNNTVLIIPDYIVDLLTRIQRNAKENETEIDVSIIKNNRVERPSCSGLIVDFKSLKPVSK